MAADRLADLDAIRTLTARYGLAVDSFDLEGVMDVYADDATLDLTSLGMPKLEGRAALREFYDGSIQGMEHQIHIVTNHVIELDGGDAAHGTHYVLANAHLKDGTKILVHGLHTDTYTRTDSGWRVATRVLTMLIPPVVDAPGAS
jgi:ketosteroid isomerase-like protein